MNGGFSVGGGGGVGYSGSACSQYLVSLVSVVVSGCMSTNNPVPPRQIVQRSSEVYTISVSLRYVDMCVVIWPRYLCLKSVYALQCNPRW